MSGFSDDDVWFDPRGQQLLNQGSFDISRYIPSVVIVVRPTPYVVEQMLRQPRQSIPQCPNRFGDGHLSTPPT
ncbi:hypothetical protein RN2511_026680 [Rhodococcus sp. NKCM2511]|nr:hypothetical protein RN2511_026680 [Rhodococcus sp. NKCM2511]